MSIQLLKPADFLRSKFEVPFIGITPNPCWYFRRVWQCTNGTEDQDLVAKFEGQNVADTPTIATRSAVQDNLQSFYSEKLVAATDMAIAVRFADLNKVETLFPHLRIQHYESVEDFWSYSLTTRLFCEGPIMPRKRYDQIVDMSNDIN